MSNREKVVAGLAVELYALDGEYEGKYRTRIEEVDEETFTVGTPMEQGELIPLREGTPVRLIFWDKVAAYGMVTTIVRREAVPISVLILELNDSVNKDQRRNYVRVQALFSLTFVTVTKTGLSDQHKAMMLDLSGGGMKFMTDERVSNNDLIYTNVALPNGELQTPARVSRAEKTEDGKRYIVSVEFQYNSERDRDRVIRCVFDLQRAMRKKGLE